MNLFEQLIPIANQAIIQIGIRLDEGDLRKWNRALTRLESETRRQALETPRLMAIDYMHLIVENIMQSKHMAGYRRYNIRYAKWKAAWNASAGFTQGYWKLAGDLVKSITYTRVGASTEGGLREYRWFAGVPAGIMDSGGKSWLGTPQTRRGPSKEIAWYGAIMEEGGVFGGQRHPARAIFKPTLKEYIDSGKGVLHGERALLLVANHWR